MTDKSLPFPLGLRLNNPGNIFRVPGVVWDGSIAQSQHLEEEFCNPLYGLRAMAITLHTYMTVHMLVSADAIVTRYAPPGTNPTADYIKYVCGQIGIQANQPLEPDTAIPELMHAMVSFEQGFSPFTHDLCRRVYQWALTEVR